MTSLSRQLVLPFRVPPAAVPRSSTGPASGRAHATPHRATPSASDASAHLARAVLLMEARA